MGLRLRLIELASIVILPATMIAGGCSSGDQTKSNSNAAPSPSAEKKGGKPADAQLEVPGFFRSGPTGTVALSLMSPTDGQTIEGNSFAPTFNITGYPIYKDDERNKGQHIHVILDNEPYEADYAPDQPFSIDKFKNLKDGTHTVRAFPSREWHESIKQPSGAFVFSIFHVGAATPGPNIDKTAPLLTYSRPKGEYRWKDDPRGLMLDFYVTNANLGLNDYRVRYSLDDGYKKDVLTHWEPVWWKWEDLMAGEHTVLLELLDKNGKPVPFKVGSTDYNRTVRKFKILGEGEAPAASAGPSNSNASKSH